MGTPRDAPTRISDKHPSHIAMGTPFPVRLAFPEKIVDVTASERDDFGTATGFFSPKLLRSDDGQTYAMITPLSYGHIKFRVIVRYRDDVRADRTFSAQVAPPDQRPAGFWADYLLHSLDGLKYERITMTQGGILQPEVMFASTPTQRVMLRGGVTFRVQDEAANPAVAVDSKGMLHGLHPGTSTVDVTLGNYTTSIDVLVSAN